MMGRDALPRRVAGELWAAARPYRRRTLAALALLVAAKLAGVTVPLLLKAVIDRVGAPAPVAAEGATMSLALVLLLLGYALLRFASTLFTELRDLVFSRVAQHVVIGFSQRCFAHLLSLGARFHARRDTGATIREVERGTAGVGFLLGAGLFTIVPTGVELLAILGVLAVGYAPPFALAVVATFAVYAFYTGRLTQRRALRQRKVNEMDSRAHGRLVDTLLNYDTVKAYAREPYERERYAEICGQWIGTAIDNQRALSALHLGQGAIIASGVAAVMLLAGERATRGTMTVGDLVLVNAYVIQICLPLNALGFVFREARDALVNIERVFGLLDERPEIADAPGAPPLQVAGGGVRFEQIDFGYEPGRRILSALDLALAPGQTVAVVGGSGSGKSTLARLLLRLYDPDAGQVRIDGQDLRTVQQASLRSAIGVVAQDTLLFNDSIFHNIAYGRLGAGRDEVLAAAQAAQVHEFILSLPQQYDTMVGERGVKLSGGERQRLAIARAFLKNPPILIFDEATSALDSRSERAIQTELDRIAVGRTTLIIAHRLSTVVDADQIVVLDKGRIVERGRHDELLQQGGLYAQMWALQRQQQQVERLERVLARQPVNLVALVANALDALRPDADARDVRLFAGIDLTQARVIGDPGTLAQAIGDVLAAALAATPTGGRMALGLEGRDGHARLSVTDGLTLGDAAPPLAPGAPPPPDPLALRSAVERQGGRFFTEARTTSSGARYLIELPLRAADALPAAPEPLPDPTPLPGGELTGLRVMCVDARPETLAALQQALQQQGAAVLALPGAGAALDWLAREPTPAWPHALVCELALGDADGYALMRQVRGIEAGRGVPLSARMPALALAGAGAAADEVRTRALLSGFQRVLTQPAPPARLVPAVRALARRLPTGTG